MDWLSRAVWRPDPHGVTFSDIGQGDRSLVIDRSHGSGRGPDRKARLSLRCNRGTPLRQRKAGGLAPLGAARASSARIACSMRDVTLISGMEIGVDARVAGERGVVTPRTLRGVRQTRCPCGRSPRPERAGGGGASGFEPSPVSRLLSDSLVRLAWTCSLRIPALSRDITPRVEWRPREFLGSRLRCGGHWPSAAKADGNSLWSYRSQSRRRHLPASRTEPRLRRQP